MNSAKGCQELALRQHGVIARSQALVQGMSSSAIDRRVHSGEWLRLLPGTYALRGSPPSFRRRATAAYLWAGEGALISHDSSGVLFNLDGVSKQKVWISSPRRLISPRVIVHRRATEGLRSKAIDVVRVTSVEQTLLDLGGTLDNERLELAVDSALRLGLTRFDRVARHLAAFGGPGVAGSTALAKLLKMREPCPRPTDSILEVGVLKLTRRFGIPAPVAQYLVELREGLMVHVDFAYPDQRLAIEVDSVRWHSGVRAIKWDNERQNLLVALGWRVLRFEWNDIVNRPAVVAAQILAALQERQIAFNFG
jgi:REase_MTES_1575/Transcriptional regulator, AbiEi antitoxin